jgi:hypothetical protein
VQKILTAQKSNDATITPKPTTAAANNKTIKGRMVLTGDLNNKPNTVVRIVSGASGCEFDVAGKSVGSVKNFAQEILNVSSISESYVRGKKVSDDYILKAGDCLEFIKPSGSKGQKE